MKRKSLFDNKQKYRRKCPCCKGEFLTNRKNKYFCKKGCALKKWAIEHPRIYKPLEEYKFNRQSDSLLDLDDALEKIIK